MTLSRPRRRPCGRTAPFFWFLTITLVSCTRSDALETIMLSIDGVELTVEVARSPEEQERGLMFRRELDDNRGMLFAYPSDRRLEFWMKNTYIPLSIAFISSQGRIIEIREMEPESLRTVTSSRSVRYALELNRGAFERIGAAAGSIVEFPEGFATDY